MHALEISCKSVYYIKSYHKKSILSPKRQKVKKSGIFGYNFWPRAPSDMCDIQFESAFQDDSNSMQHDMVAWKNVWCQFDLPIEGVPCYITWSKNENFEKILPES
jgi:hypothetical protein